MPNPASAPTARVLQILEYFALKPTEAYGLSELARNVGMSKSTCLAIMNTLVEAGYIIQHSALRHYSLGPAAVAVGQAAMMRFPDTVEVLPLLRRLARDHGMVATAEAVAGDQIVVIASVGLRDPMRGIGRTGVRLPFAPPYGAPLAAGADRTAFQDYLERADPPLTRSDTQHLLASLEAGRRRGYFVGLDLPAGHKLHDRLEEAWNARSPADFVGELSAARRIAGYFLDAFDDKQEYRVSSITAPVVPASGEVQLALGLLAFGWRARGAEIRNAGEALAAAAAQLAGGSGS